MDGRTLNCTHVQTYKWQKQGTLSPIAQSVALRT